MKKILVTSGEPAGIGPDLCIAMAGQDWPFALTFLGDPALFEHRARRLGVSLAVEAVDQTCNTPHQAGILRVWPTQNTADTTPGHLCLQNAAYVLETIATGARACLDGRFNALVTPPVHKGIINDAGYRFSGHTEFLAEQVGGTPVMMLATDTLRVALATTHLPLAEVSRAITAERLTCVLKVLQQDLRNRFGLAEPRILVCGLNPHAGEGGHLGREELEVIMPTLEGLRQQGLHLTGPLPADTLFLPRHLARADAVLAMYHDQGLPVLKYAGFGRAVNITLGLPIIRTSVDHGTALDLAGTGQADPGSLAQALTLAHTLANHA
ncbi:4-hydroxythreonine-4-phosphate dehydrogenase PdxA [Candidatus Woesearchaeota archaeon]|nr:4-hydroxythreonine-4-phosphate dehydrogenase PdxA [Candidatus Woesearchaeota archaeon]